MPKAGREELGTAIGIVRVSTFEQGQGDRYSLPHQKSHIKEECQARGIRLLNTFEFIQSGAKVMSETGERRRVLDYIRQHQVQVVVVHELDRLARSMLDTLVFVDELDKAGVAIISVHDKFDTSTPQGRLQMHILAAFAEYFRKQLASKVLGGMLERAQKGLPMHGNRPFGYRFALGANAKLAAYEVVEEEAKIIRLMYDLYLGRNGQAQLGYRGIADYLNRDHIATRKGGIWQASTVRELLANEVYVGAFVWRDVRIPNSHPPIIDEETFAAVAAMARRKASMGRAPASDFLLSGMLRCAQCGGSMVGVTTHKTYKGKPLTYKYYLCDTYRTKGRHACAGGYYRCEMIDGQVLGAIQQFQPGVADVLPADADEVRELIRHKTGDLSRLDGMLDRAAAAYEAGQYDLDFFSQRKKALLQEQEDIRQEVAQLELRLHRQPDKAHVAKKLRDVKALLKDPARAKAVLMTIIDRVTVAGPEDMRITFRL